MGSKYKRNPVAATVIYVSLLLSTIVIWHWLGQPPKATVPKAVRQQYTFNPLLTPVNKTAQIATQNDSYKYDRQNRVLSYVVTVQNKRVTISQQPYPDVLIFDKLVNGFNVYSQLDTKIGKVYLGHPGSAGGGQAAVARTDSLLIFGKSDRDLDNSQWRAVFDNLSAPQ